MKSPVFICGTPRSGTTLFLALLDSHPELVVFPEETQFKEISKQKHISKKAWVKKFLSETNIRNLNPFYIPNEMEIMGGRGIIEYDFNFSAFSKFVIERFIETDGTPAELFESLMGCYEKLTNQNGRYYVEKNPSNEFRLHQYIKWWPDLRAIYVVRDPRANYLSLKSKREKEGKEFNVCKFVYNWGSSFDSWMRNFVTSDRFYMVRYEDLLNNRELTMRQISNFLNICYDPIMLFPTKMGLPWKGVSSSGEVVQQKIHVLGEKWKELLLPDEVNYIEAFLGKLMGILGYKLLSPRFEARKFIRILLSQDHSWRIIRMSIRLYLSILKPHFG